MPRSLVLLLLTILLFLLVAGCSGGGSGGQGLPRPVISVRIAPGNSTVALNTAQTFTATVSNTTNTAVTWSLEEGATGGTITSAGVYTAPGTAGTYHLIATSQADSTKTDRITITVPIALSVNPPTKTLTLSETQNFTATVQGTPNTGVTWRVLQGVVGGSVTAGGVYTAPNAPGTFRVVATSQADPSREAEAVVTVQAGSASGTIQ